MLTERLQILLAPEQRRRLDAEASRRGTSVAAVIREAIDAHLGVVTREQRLEAVEAIRRADAIPFVPPEELNRIAEEEHEAGWPAASPR
jgi:predicted DNA-binding protein